MLIISDYGFRVCGASSLSALRTDLHFIWCRKQTFRPYLKLIEREFPVCVCVCVFAVLFVYGTTHRMHVSMCWVVIKLQSEAWCGTRRFLTSSFQVTTLKVPWLSDHLLLYQLFCDQYAIIVYTDEQLVFLLVSVFLFNVHQQADRYSNDTPQKYQGNVCFNISTLEQSNPSLVAWQLSPFLQCLTKLHSTERVTCLRGHAQGPRPEVEA